MRAESHCKMKNAAGIDIGSGKPWVAIHVDRDEKPVRSLAALRQICMRWLLG